LFYEVWGGVREKKEKKEGGGGGGGGSKDKRTGNKMKYGAWCGREE